MAALESAVQGDQRFTTVNRWVGDKHIRFYTYREMQCGMWAASTSGVDLVKREIRGVAVDVTTGAVVARPFRKFWGVGQHVDAQVTQGDIC